MQARDGRERACSERGAAGEPCAEAMARAKRAGRRRCLRQVSVGAEWVPSLEGWSGSGAARNAAVPQRSGPLGLARVRERAGADDVRSGAQRRRLAVKAPARAGARALGTTRRASTRGFGAALARLSVWRWMRSGERVREHRGGVRAYRIRWGRWGTPKRSSRRRSRSDPLDRVEMADPVGTGLIATYPLPNRDLLAAVGAVLSAKWLYLLRFLGGPLETRTPDPLIKSQLLYQLS